MLERLRAWRFGHAQAALSSLGALWRSPLGTLLTSAVIGVALALPAAALIVVSSLFNVSTYLGTDTDVSVFLHPDVADTQGAALADAVQAMPGVAAVRLIGKDQALEEFRAAAQASYGLEGLGETNPLPVVLVVSPADTSDAALDALAAKLEARAEVDFVQDDRDWLSRIEAASDVVRRAVWLATAILSVGIVLVVGNTVRLGIESRRNEVEIAKLFGASDAFVRRPFLYHGLYYGLAGGVIACGLLAVGGVFLEPAVARLGDLYDGRLPIARAGAMHFLSLLAGGAVLGLAGAWLWVGRHLRRVEPR